MPLSVPDFLKLSSEPILVTFRHAGRPLDVTTTILLRLRGSANYGGGVHSGTALTALNIIADNAFEVKTWLTTARDGGKVSGDYNSSLRRSEYWFHVANPDDPKDHHYHYPVVPCFQMWSMPEFVPEHWILERRPGSAVSRNNLHGAPTSITRDDHQLLPVQENPCILSGELGANCKRTALFPTSEYFWWVEEWRKKWNAFSAQSIKHALEFSNNSIRLRSDLAHAFEGGHFVLVPQRRRWVAYFFDSTTPLGREFDGKTLKFHANVPVEYLLPRFAREVFEQAKDLED